MPFQQLNQQELQQYFRRISCGEQQPANLQTLQLLHRQHAMNIPFENLNAWLGLPVALSKEELLRKMAAQKRGGYCFEHNLLLGHVLKTLGFAVEGLAARVCWMLPADVVMARTHMALLVTLDGKRYLADVGFGGVTLTAPLLLDLEAPQATTHEQFRITRKEQYFTLAVLLNDSWHDMYSFTLDVQHKPDYEMANWFVATHPESRFVNNLIAARVDTDGRHALLNQHYARHLLHKPSEKIELPSAAAVRAVLQERFLIETDNLPGLNARLDKLFTASSS